MKLFSKPTIFFLLILTAQESTSQSAIPPYLEYRKRIEATRISPLDSSNLFGEQISLYNGSTSFSVTDIDLPGNNTLPVQLVRHLAIDLQQQSLLTNTYDALLGGAGNWDVDVPYMAATYHASAGNALRCNGAYIPPISIGAGFWRGDVWQGISIHLPGRGQSSALSIPSAVPRPSGNTIYKLTTRERDVFDCIPMQGNFMGKGFRMTTASGLRYYFDFAVTRTAAQLVKYRKSYGTGLPLPFYLNRYRHYLLASKIEDRFGNSVQIQYNNNGHPIKIWANDGREINLSYMNGRLSTAISHGRVWHYQYHGDNLVAVTQPDNSQWQYAYTGTLRPTISLDGLSGLPWCMGIPSLETHDFSLQATHPSGITGVFAFQNQRHYRSGVHATECIQTGDPANPDYELLVPHYFDVMSINSKSLSGPGLHEMTWHYNYEYGFETLWGHRTEPPAYPCSTCTESKTVTITQPNGTKHRHTFGMRYHDNDGRELKVEVLRADNTQIKSQTNTYMTEVEAASQPFHGEYGGILGFISDPTSARIRPVTRRTIHQDGTVFVWQAHNFDHLGRPRTVTQSSTAIGNPTRTEETLYHDNSSKWVLGQISQVKCTAPIAELPKGCGTNGVPISETTYDNTYALPLVSKQFGRITQTLGWDTTSSITSGQRGTIKTVTDGNGHTVTLSAWKRGIPQAIQYPATLESPSGATQSAQVNDAGWITRVTDENGYSTGYGYDAMGRLASITYPGGDSAAWHGTSQVFEQVNAVEYGIPAGHWRQTVATGNGRKVTYFDALWRPLLVREYDTAHQAATQRFQRFAYDHEGRVTFAAYPASAHNSNIGTHTRYDALGRVVQVQQDSELSPALLTTRTEYLSGFKTRVTDPKGNQTTTSYMAWDAPVTDFPVHIAHPGGAHTHIQRDVFGKPTRIRRSNSANPDAGTGINRSYSYNAQQLLCRSVEPETGTTLMGYDGAGNLKWSASGLTGTPACELHGNGSAVAARRVSRSYDARNRLSQLSFPDGRGNQTWRYTPDGLPATITTHNSHGGNTVTNSYSYNKRRLLVQETTTADASNPWTLGYGYNANGHLNSHSYPAGLTAHYTLNALGQVTQISAQDGSSVNVASNISYFPNGAVKGFTYGNGITHTATQNTRGLPQRITDCTTPGTCNSANRRLDLQYGYDRNGNTTAITDHSSGGLQTRTMGYDAQDRLTQVTSSMFGTAKYSYDVLDNLTRVQVGASALHPARDHGYCYSHNRLSSIRASHCNGSLIETLTYDAQGNLASKGGQSYSFDYGNRLRSHGGNTQYLYDGHGRRVRYSATGSAPQLYGLYDYNGQLRWQRDEQAGQRIRHIYLGNRLIAEHRKPIGSNTVTIEYLHSDAQGSPLVRTNAARNAIETSQYEPYGRLVNRANNNRPGYTGHVQDSATGLTYMQQRYYDPMLGVFLSTDPVTAYGNPIGQFHRYRYANNNPYKFFDPDGRQSVGEMIDSAAEGCGAVTCAGWAATKALWGVFGAEGVSQIADKGIDAGSGSMLMAGVEVVTLGQGGKVGAGIKALTSVSKWFSPTAQLSRQISKEFGVASSAARNNAGEVFKLAEGKVTVRIMESGGGRADYMRVSVEGKGSVDASGKFSSDRAKTHIPIRSESIDLIRDIVRRYEK